MYLPVQVESGNLGIVTLEVRKVKVIGECLLLPREPEEKSLNYSTTSTVLNTDHEIRQVWLAFWTPTKHVLFHKSDRRDRIIWGFFILQIYVST